ncbi:MAG: O-antigen ligase family protein [Dehalococcoidia bacterium]|nr:O-antigen ligase family protein [Dehalococcoidia bacterium]
MLDSIEARNLVEAAVPGAKQESLSSDVIAISGLTLAVALYYFADSLWLSLLAAVLFTLIAVRRIDLALIFVILSSPFYLFPKYFGSLSFSLSEFCVLSCGLAAIWLGVLETIHRGLTHAARALLQFLTTELKRPVVLFLIASSLSLFASDYLKYSLREYRTVVIEPALFYFVMTAYVTEQKQVWRLVNAFLLLSVGVALFSLFHYYFVGLVESTDGVRRVLAVYHSPNALSLFLGRSAPMLVALALFYPARGGTGRRVLYALGSLAVLACLYITYSRGAWLGIAAALVFVALIRGRRYVLWTGGVVVCALLALIPLVGVDRLLSRTASMGRLYLWQSALAMIRDHPFMGVGLDNFLYQYPRYILKEAWAEPNVSHPHNIVLDFWTRIGVLGVAALVWLQIRFWQSGLSVYRGAANDRIGILALALMSSMVSLLAHGLIDNSFFLIDLAIAFWLIYGSIETLKKEAT